MKFLSINPTTNQLLKRFNTLSNSQLTDVLKKAEFGFAINRTSSLKTRSKRMNTLAGLLMENQIPLAKLITMEMGKPIEEAKAEIKKCAWVCEYYANNAKHFLKDEIINTENSASVITHAPLGVLLAIMPWNFPFWQVFRFAAPALMAGNSVILKHAANVPQCAIAIEQLFRTAQFSEGLFQSIFVDHGMVKRIIEDPMVRGISLTGSNLAGSTVAELAGKNIKKTVLELGGSDPFIVLDDANLKLAAEAAIQSRMSNAGQSCIAAKRLIVVEPVLNSFVELLTEHIRQLKVGDPMNEDTDVGPLAREDLAETVAKQVKESMRLGAEAVIGGNRPADKKGAFFNPTLLVNVKEGMPVFEEEIFGPVAAVIAARDVQHAISLANKTKYGLGSSIWTLDRDKATRLARQIQAGGVFINTIVHSDPRLPFGGIKQSGYGRELSSYGIREFVNTKTIVVN
ncbi:MAG: NAD-dependent succinate-semialdehyde dehydrogenase [Chitinophagales bacterium]